MKIEIVKILDRGVENKERLWLKAINDCNLVYYLVFDTKYVTENSISSAPKNAFWFKDKKVKAGDSIILYTKNGVQSESKNNDGTTNHFVFWGKDKPLWSAIESCAVLYEINSWITSKKE